MIKYCIVLLGCMLILGDVSAGSKKDRHVHFSPETKDTSSGKPLKRKQPKDIDLVIKLLEEKAEQLKRKELRDLPFDVVAETIRSYLEAKPENSNGVSDKKYFELFGEVMHEIMPEAVDDSEEDDSE